MGNSKSQLIEYMKQIAGMTQGRQHEFFQWKVDSAKLLMHVKTDEIRNQYPEIDAYLNDARPKVVQKECYKNAGQLTQAIEGVSYVEGEISYHGIPIEHAWNKIDGKYFDITKDVLFPKNSDYAEYVAIIELSGNEFREFMMQTKTWGGFLREKFIKDNKIEESFYPRISESVTDKAYENSGMDKYYEKNFGIRYGYDKDTINSYNIVAKVGKYKTAIVLNPKSLEGFDGDVRAIADKDGNLYVAMHEKYFNHGEMANALIDAKLINTVRYNEKAQKVSEVAGLYNDQKNFLLLNRFEDEDLFIQSDTFEWEGDHSESMLRNLQLKNPQFKYDVNHDFDDGEFNKLYGESDEIDESVINESPDKFVLNNMQYSPKNYTGVTLSFEVILNTDNAKITDVLVSKEKNNFHGDDDITNGSKYGESGTRVNYSGKLEPYKFNWKKVYPGRLFLEPKVITFWVYPDKKEMKKIIELIEEKTDLQIINNGWTIEIYKAGFKYNGGHDYENNYDRDSDEKEFVPVEKFVGSKKPPEKEFLQHLDTKTKHKVPYGYGSKNPEYMNKRKWQMASLTDEGKKEAFYPRID